MNALGYRWDQVQVGLDQCVALREETRAVTAGVDRNDGRRPSLGVEHSDVGYIHPSMRPARRILYIRTALGKR